MKCLILDYKFLCTLHFEKNCSFREIQIFFFFMVYMDQSNLKS